LPGGVEVDMLVAPSSSFVTSLRSTLWQWDANYDHLENSVPARILAVVALEFDSMLLPKPVNKSKLQNREEQGNREPRQEGEERRRKTHDKQNERSTNCQTVSTTNAKNSSRIFKPKGAQFFFCVPSVSSLWD